MTQIQSDCFAVYMNACSNSNYIYIELLDLNIGMASSHAIKLRC